MYTNRIFGVPMATRLYGMTACCVLLAMAMSLPVQMVGQATKKPKQEPKPMSKEQAKTVKQDANSLFAASSYDLALKEYLNLYKSDAKNVDVNFRLGYCYLMTDINKAEGVKYLEYAVENDTKKKDLLYYLALAYHYSNDFDNAIKYYNEYKEQAHNKLIKDFLNADRQIEMCENGKMLFEHPVDVTFTNPGKMVNSPQADYNPYISADGTTLVYSARKKGSTGGLDEEIQSYGADVYWSQWKDSAWTKAKSTGAAVN